MKYLMAAIAVFLFVAPAHAKHYHHHHYRHHVSHAYSGRVIDANGNRVVGHPEGCPHIAFCGCGASVRIFGHPIRSLYLAANWFKFPHAAPAPGMVAVRSHHVFVIEQVYGDGTVLAYDANSGGHETRIHRVSLAGYSVRNPNGA